MGGWSGLLDAFMKWVDRRGKKKRQRTRRVEDALRAIHNALTETQIYDEKRMGKGRRSRSRELHIAHIWNEAAIAFRSIDRDLSHRCRLKGGYWRQPDTWDREQIIERRIGIEQMITSADSLLLGD